ncbi:MAG: DUF1059 domain-containing protein [Dehalococcoidales bacterium]|nr:DUF1059 domain-containing protein [Dehalococcoidales bacterium]
MPTFKCADVGMACSFEASAATKEELMQKIAKHGEEAHGLKTIPPDIMAKVEQAIKV